MINIKKILVPTDFSQHSKEALRYAVALAEVHGAEIILGHVMEPPIYPTMFEGAAVAVPPLDESFRKQLEDHLDDLRKEEVGDTSSRIFVREGSPTTELTELAREEDVDLIVIATHGYTGIKHMLLGSTAEKVVRNAPCPVLTVREKTKDICKP
ncbi:MAG: universal stress protein [Planctomycetota bacterium]